VSKNLLTRVADASGHALAAVVDTLFTGAPVKAWVPAAQAPPRPESYREQLARRESECAAEEQRRLSDITAPKASDRRGGADDGLRLNGRPFPQW
jgi:hypothetical protein